MGFCNAWKESEIRPPLVTLTLGWISVILIDHELRIGNNCHPSQPEPILVDFFWTKYNSSVGAASLVMLSVSGLVDTP